MCLMRCLRCSPPDDDDDDDDFSTTASCGLGLESCGLSPSDIINFEICFQKVSDFQIMIFVMLFV